MIESGKNDLKKVIKYGFGLLDSDHDLNRVVRNKQLPGLNQTTRGDF